MQQRCIVVVGADVNQKFIKSDNFTSEKASSNPLPLLFLAFWNNDAGMIELLLEFGADKKAFESNELFQSLRSEKPNLIKIYDKTKPNSNFVELNRKAREAKTVSTSSTTTTTKRSSPPKLVLTDNDDDIDDKIDSASLETKDTTKKRKTVEKQIK